MGSFTNSHGADKLNPYARADITMSAFRLHTMLRRPTPSSKLPRKMPYYRFPVLYPEDFQAEADSNALMLEKSLQRSPQRRWGFVVFRCTYRDQARWRRFMEIMNMRAFSKLCTNLAYRPLAEA